MTIFSAPVTCKDEYKLNDWQPLAETRPSKRPKDLLQPVSLDDVKAMVNVCPTDTFNGLRDRALLYFLVDSGVRHQELVDLRVGHVDVPRPCALGQGTQEPHRLRGRADPFLPGCLPRPASPRTR